MKNASKLRGKDIFLNDDFPQEILEKRQELRPYLKLAKTKDQKATLIEDKLRFNGKLYNKQTIATVLDCSDLSQVEVNGNVFFAGEHSLSNLFPCSLTHKNITYNSAEQMFQHLKAVSLADAECAANVLAAPTPFKALMAGQQLRANKEWIEKDGSDIMAGILRKKAEHVPAFKQALTRHKGKKLIDANKNTVWGAGISLSSLRSGEAIPNWNGSNRLGKMLAKLSDEL